MSEQVGFSLFSLREFAPLSAILVFRVADSGSPQQDWCRHLAANPLYRRELEEFAVLGDTVVRLADGVEPPPFEKVRVLSAEYLVRHTSSSASDIPTGSFRPADGTDS